MHNTIGIVGGMGPMATCDLFRKIVEIEDSATDQDHVRVCIDSNTEIPDRTAAILHGGKDPVDQMVRSAIRLQSMGAQVLIMPCNTAHYFYDQVTRFEDVPFLNMLEETARAAYRQGFRKVGILATDGTIQSGVYARAFAGQGVETVCPTGDHQKAVMELIYDGVKAGKADLDTTGFLAAVEELRTQGAETMILGCTELPLAYDMYHLDFPHLDPTLIVAARAVEFVGGRIRDEYREACGCVG